MSKQIKSLPHTSKKDNIIYLFHHIHHDSDVHRVHHCGGNHKGVDY